MFYYSINKLCNSSIKKKYEIIHFYNIKNIKPELYINEIVGSSMTEEGEKRYFHQFIYKAPLTQEEDRKGA